MWKFRDLCFRPNRFFSGTKTNNSDVQIFFWSVKTVKREQQHQQQQLQQHLHCFWVIFRTESAKIEANFVFKWRKVTRYDAMWRDAVEDHIWPTTSFDLFREMEHPVMFKSMADLKEQFNEKNKVTLHRNILESFILKVRIFQLFLKCCSGTMLVYGWPYMGVKIVSQLKWNKRNLIEFTIKNLEFTYQLEKRLGRQNILPPN